MYGGTLDNDTGLYFLNWRNSSQPDIEFSIGAVEIKIPNSEMVINPSSIILDGAAGAYVMGLVRTDDPFILGDTFLRAAYVVFDIDSLQVGLAQELKPKISHRGLPGGRSN